MRTSTKTYSGWGRVKRATGHVARPEKPDEIDITAPAIGNCRSYGDASLNTDGTAIDTTWMDRILHFDAKTGQVTVEAGMQIGALARIFAGRGWIPAVMPGTGFATIGGCIAHDVHGKNHHIHGSFGQHVVKLTLLQNGVRKTVSPKSNKELFAATVGGLGQTGVIVQAVLQLMPCAGDVMMVTEQRADGWDEFVALLDASVATYTVGWIDATATGDTLGRGILEEAELGRGIVPDSKQAKSVPFNAPNFALSAPIVKLFNAAYFRRVPERGRTSVKPIGDFFFPLDKIHDWNRLYGKRGFHQFQCVVPVERAPALREMLRMIAASGLASPLAVLKRMGAGSAGMMSFPMDGYTLAVDFPNKDGAEPLIRTLIDKTAEIGGRVYLAKDALATGDQIKPMYPNHAKWIKAVTKADPDGAMETDIIRRLNLRTPL